MHWAYCHQMPSNHLNVWSHHPKPSTLAPVFTVSISKAAARPGNLEREKSENCFKVDTQIGFCVKLPSFLSFLFQVFWDSSVSTAPWTVWQRWKQIEGSLPGWSFHLEGCNGCNQRNTYSIRQYLRRRQGSSKKDSTLVQCTVSICWYSRCHWANPWYSTWVW